MKQEFVKPICDALRSGKYKQGSGTLRDVDDQFCCLGVMCDQKDQKAWYINGLHYEVDGSYNMLPGDVADYYGMKTRGGDFMHEGMELSLWKLNDGRYLEDIELPTINGPLVLNAEDKATFSQIADVIETYLGTAVISYMIEEILTQLGRQRFSLTSEAELQNQISTVLPAGTVREHRFDPRNRVDFFIDGLAIEVKIKGNAMAIYKQCERYCQFAECKALILVTNRSMGFPEVIAGKPCYVVNLGRSWL